MNWNQLNWVDWVIVAVTAFYVLRGWEDGLAKLLTELGAFLGSLWLSARYHTAVGKFVAEKFGLPLIWADVVGYTLIWSIGEYVLLFLVAWLLHRLPQKLFDNDVNRVLGSALSALKGLVIMAVILMFLNLLPLQGTVKSDIKKSVIGSQLLKTASQFSSSSLPQISPPR